MDVKKTPDVKMPNPMWGLAAALPIFAIGVLYAGSTLVFEMIREPVIPNRSEDTLIVVLWAALVGFAMSALRRWQKVLYGLGEFAAATVGVWAAVRQLSGTPATRVLAVAGAVYLMSRGINNVWDAVDNKKSSIP